MSNTSLRTRLCFYWGLGTFNLSWSFDSSFILLVGEFFGSFAWCGFILFVNRRSKKVHSRGREAGKGTPGAGDHCPCCPALGHCVLPTWDAAMTQPRPALPWIWDLAREEGAEKGLDKTCDLFTSQIKLTVSWPFSVESEHCHQRHEAPSRIPRAWSGRVTCVCHFPEDISTSEDALGGCGLQKEAIFSSLNVHFPCLHLKILGAAILSGNESLEYVFAQPKSGKCPLVPEIGERTQALGLGSKQGHQPA